MKRVWKFVGVVAAFTVVATLAANIIMEVALWLLFNVIYQR